MLDILLVQHLGRVWHFGPRKIDLQGRRLHKEETPNGNKEKGHEESCQEEKAVTVAARPWPRLTFAKNQASAIAVRGGLSLCDGALCAGLRTTLQSGVASAPAARVGGRGAQLFHFPSCASGVYSTYKWGECRRGRTVLAACGHWRCDRQPAVRLTMSC